MSKYLVLLLSCGAFLLGACSSVTPIRFKVHSEPEGAYVLYQVTGSALPCADRWIYLGNTPLQGIYQFDTEKLRASDRIALRVMQQGYMDQSREWTGRAFYDEVRSKGLIFWVPEMVPAGTGR